MMELYDGLINKYRGILRIKLIVLLLFGALSAFAGGFGLIFMNGLNMPLSYLTGSPFHTFFGPGLILFFVVGGTNLLGAITVLKNNKYATEWAAVAGFGLEIWIYTELYIIKQATWLQTLYFALGIIILILTIAMLRADKEHK
jgi:hypothetical protein